MATEIIKTVKGRQYRYLQRSVRVPGRRTPKTESVYLGPVGGNPRKAADEKYREVLRDNMHRFGTTRPGARYASEARAREQYHRDMGFKGTEGPGPQTPSERQQQGFQEFWLKVDTNKRSSFETRHAAYNLSHPSATYRVAAEFQRVRDEVRQQDARIAAQEAPQQTAAAPAKDFTVDDEIEARQAQQDEAVD